MPTNLDSLRRHAVVRSLFEPTTLERALDRIGFVQADPIRAPARAQDLTLRHRVEGYRAGDLERRYATLPIEEDFFVVYGFVPRAIQALMHPRSRRGVAVAASRSWSPQRRKRAQLILDFVRERGSVHPREVEEHFAHGKVTNYWGGSSNATTQLLDAMHYRGMLRVIGRESGTRTYAAHRHGPEPADAAERRRRIDALVNAVVNVYAPLPARSLNELVRRLRYAVPQWRGELGAALERVRQRLAHARVDGIDWYWPAAEDPDRNDPPEAVRLLTPFDPVVWDRRRLELLWGWVYRFEAYTPPAKRKLGYYALPLLWRDRVIGWGNLSVRNGRLEAQLGYIEAPPRARAFKRELAAELARMRAFLDLEA
ncbi:MAG TPA: crosslink repair DNA glycosylase YcaQ family protein [Casimicrobiaceae bacterium]|nr:crosslink repair DNA glycosylase YcaQ family protein [Casimicrobiaceae bacterium]